MAVGKSNVHVRSKVVEGLVRVSDTDNSTDKKCIY